MIIKEFRIIFPMSVDEYQIGQLFTIQKKSRIESTGAGSGVEIIENKPFENQNEKGQYTLKVYHVDERLPSSLKTATKLLFPKSALLFEEESWNLYPYTRTKYKHKLFKSFNIDIESKFQADLGQSENVFNLSKKELAVRVVDYIDIVSDPISSHEYKPEEDPGLFKSECNSRGPLGANWINELKANVSSSSSKPMQYLCAYKLCRVECAFWGCQSRVEKLISESVLRNMILISHRQAWCWQDEYANLTMDDVRQLELETQHYLNMKMRNESLPDLSLTNLTNMRNKRLSKDLKAENSKDQLVPGEMINPVCSKYDPSINSAEKRDSIVAKRLSQTQMYHTQSQEEPSDYEDIVSTDSMNLDKYQQRTNESNMADTSVGFSFEDNENDLAFNLQMLNNKNEMDENADEDNYEAQSQNSNFDEFYDAISQVSFNLSTNTNESESISTMSLNGERSSKKSKSGSPMSLSSKQNRFQFTSSNNNTKSDSHFTSNPNEYKKINATQLKAIPIEPTIHENNSSAPNFNQTDAKNLHKQNSQIDTLFLVVHGGNVTCTDTSKQSDFSNFKSTFDAITKLHFPNRYQQIAFRLVPCESICKQALIKLSALSPVANESPVLFNESDNFAEVFALNENLQFSTIPLLALANRSNYKSQLSKFTRTSNQVYHEFLLSKEGHNFQGQVVVIGDSIGSLLVYDSLCQANNVFPSCDDNSSLNASSTNSSLLNVQSPKLRSVHSTSPSPIFTRKFNNPMINVNDSEVDNGLNAAFNNNGKQRGCSSVSSGNDSSNGSFLTPPSQSGTITLSLPHLPSVNTSDSAEERLDFDVSHFFVFGSPLGLVLANQKLTNNSLESPCCTQIYNLFHLNDPAAIRIEPLLCKQFSNIQPCMVPRYSKFPLGDGANYSLDHFIVKHGNLFETNNLFLNPLNQNEKQSQSQQQQLRVSDMSSSYLTPNYDQLKSLHKIIQTKKNWWGDNRIDYVLYAPEKIANLPKKSLPYLFHSCYWESFDVVAFILRIVTKSELFQYDYNPAAISTMPKEENVEKWQKRFNRVKLRNLSANHRANDVIVLEDKEQQLNAKFSYGPLDFALSGEKVDIFIMGTTVKSEWQLYACEQTDNHGRIKYEIPKEKCLPLGMYQVKMVVKCDHSFVEFQMAVLPVNTEAVVFSIDGSFAANISFTGTDPKVRAGAVDVVRHWQDLGYLIIYVTARPDIQHYKVTNWLAQHNFPLGMVYFSDGLSRDPLRQKTEILRSLVLNNMIKIQAAYGSTKDIQMYSSLGVQNCRIFIIGKVKSKYVNQATILRDGYASHLNFLQNPNTSSRQALGDARLILKKTTFSIRLNPVFNNLTNHNDLNNHSSSLIAQSPINSNANQNNGNETPTNSTISTTTTTLNHNNNNSTKLKHGNSFNSSENQAKLKSKNFLK